MFATQVYNINKKIYYKCEMVYFITCLIEYSSFRCHIRDSRKMLPGNYSKVDGGARKYSSFLIPIKMKFP